MRKLFAAAAFVGAVATAALAGAAGGADPVADEWDALFLNGQKVGHSHVLSDRVDAGGKTVVRTRSEMKLATKRFDDRTETSVVADAFELPSGLLYAVDLTIRAAQQDQNMRGRLGADYKFKFASKTPGKTEEKTIDWADDVLSPFAPERSLRERPMKPGETREFKTFLPELGVVAKQTLVAKALEPTTLLDGATRELLRVEETNDQVPLARSLWVDEKGAVLKSTIPMGGLTMTSYRTSKAKALDEPAGEGFDVGYQTLVKPDRPLPGVHAAKSATYRLEFAEPKLADAIPEASYQRIVERKPGMVRLEIRPLADAGGQAADEPGPEFLASNGFIQSDNPKIVETARSVVGSTSDPLAKAKKLEAWVDRNMTNRDFSVGFATAGEVIETRQGDCTEHAVLLAALCRAAGVPARVAMGLVYIEPSQSFGYHMWTEVWAEGRWRPLDGTIGQGAIGGGHVKFADASMKSGSAMSTFLPILSLVGKTKIFVEKIEK